MIVGWGQGIDCGGDVKISTRWSAYYVGYCKIKWFGDHF